MFGRRHIISPPLCHHVSMMAGLCRPHHRKRTVQPGCEEDLFIMHAAIERGWKAWGHDWESIPLTRAEYCGEARQLENVLRAGQEWQALLEAAGRG